MNAQVLIDSIVRQVTVLIAQLATSGGIRAPLSHVANQVFVDLARELEAQGVSRKVSADMFGMALRAYIRKVRRLSEAQTEQGQTLWQALLEFVRAQGLVTRARVLERFDLDGELQVTAVLRDLIESGLVFCSGSGKGAVYRAASDEELDRLMQLSDESGLDELAAGLGGESGNGGGVGGAAGSGGGPELGCDESEFRLRAVTNEASGSFDNFFYGAEGRLLSVGHGHFLYRYTYDEQGRITLVENDESDVGWQVYYGVSARANTSTASMTLSWSVWLNPGKIGRLSTSRAARSACGYEAFCAAKTGCWCKQRS